MQPTRRSLAAAVALAALVTAGGCGEAPKAGDRATKDPATVAGTVTVKGKAARRGRLNFEPLGPDGIPIGSYVAQVGKDGTYSVKTVAGRNDVTVTSTGDPAIDSHYNKTGFEAKPGPNSLNLDLPLEP